MTEQYINPRNFLVETWADLFRSPGGPRQYAKFVQHMISCFRSKKEGRFEEVHAFFQLATAEERLFLSTTVAQIPELNALPRHGPTSPCMILLVNLLKEVLRQNATKSPVVKRKVKETYENGLCEDDRAKIKEFMFTSKNMELNPSQERFLQSTINLGFPKAEVAASAKRARQTNTEMPRDADGLPIHLGVCLNNETKPLPRHSEKMLALLHATHPVERPMHERLSPPSPKWPFHVFPSASKKTNVHENFVRHGTPNQVDTGRSSFYTSSSKESGCSFYKGQSSDEGIIHKQDPPLTAHNQIMGGFFTYEFDATRKQDIYEDNDNEPGQPFHMDANLTAGGAGPIIDISIPRDQDVENNDCYPANVPAEFLILHESDCHSKSLGSLDSDNHDENCGILHGKEQEREMSGSDEKEIELRKLDQIAEELWKIL